MIAYIMRSLTNFFHLNSQEIKYSEDTKQTDHLTPARHSGGFCSWKGLLRVSFQDETGAWRLWSVHSEIWQDVTATVFTQGGTCNTISSLTLMEYREMIKQQRWHDTLPRHGYTSPLFLGEKIHHGGERGEEGEEEAKEGGSEGGREMTDDPWMSHHTSQQHT